MTTPRSPGRLLPLPGLGAVLALTLQTPLGCAPGDESDEPRVGPGSTGDTDEPTTDPDTASADTGLPWDGDIAVFDGCAEGDPEARMLDQLTPSGPVGPGAAVPGEVVFANCGDSTWLAALTEDAVSGVKLGAKSDTVMHTWGKERALLPADVPPGHAVRIAWEGTAPLVNGAHPWQWQLVDEWVRWIDDPTPVADVVVEGGFGPFVVHWREEWEESDQPVDGPDSDLLDLEYITIHYNGTTEDLDGDDDVYTDEDSIDSLRNTQDYVLRTTGYSAGYNVHIAPDGDEWEIRGYDIMNAASGCEDVNRPGFTIVVPTTDPSAEPTPAQVEGVRAAVLRIRQAAAEAGNTNFLYINGHRDVRPLCDDGGGTSCPGEPLYALVLDGSFEP